MAESNGNSVTVPPSVPIIGGTKITGATAILAIMVAGGMYWIYDQNKIRNQQFERIERKLDEQDRVRGEQFVRLECKLDVGAFVYTYPKGQIDWSALPVDLHSCLPNFKPK